MVETAWKARLLLKYKCIHITYICWILFLTQRGVVGGERERLNVGKKSIVHTGWIRLGRFLSQNTKDFFNRIKK